MPGSEFSFNALAQYGSASSISPSPQLIPSFQQPAPPIPQQDMYAISGISQCYKILNKICRAVDSVNNTFEVKPTQKPQGLELISNGHWQFRRKDGSMVDIGKVAVNNVLVVNPDPDNPFKFQALFFELIVDETSTPVVIPYNDIIKRNIYQHLVLPLGRADDPEFKPSYANYLFFRLCNPKLNPGRECNFINLPTKSGWSPVEGHAPTFAALNYVIPPLRTYYPDAILKRNLPETDRSLQDIVQEYRKALPDHWKYKLLVSIRVASLLLYFFKNEGLIPDQLMLIGYPSAPTGNLITALLKNTNYDNYAAIPLIQNRNQNELVKYILSANDSVAIFSDNSLEGQEKMLKQRLQLISSNFEAQGDTGNRLLAVLSKNTAAISEEFQFELINFYDAEETPDNKSIKTLQTLSGQFDYALIRRITSNYVDSSKEITEAIEKGKGLSRTYRNSERINTASAIYASANLLNKYGLISAEELGFISKYLNRNNETNVSAAVVIGNEFRQIFNQLIRSSIIKAVPQYGPPFFQKDHNMAFDDGAFLNLEKETFEVVICGRMQYTKRVNVIKKALAELHYIYGTNGHMRMIDVDLSKTEHASVSVISISKNILDEQSEEKLFRSVSSDIYYGASSLPGTTIVPLLADRSQNSFSGVNISPTSDENFHLYVSGISRAGKSSYLLQHALFRANNGEFVIIFDNSSSFTPESIERFYKDKPDAATEKYAQKLIEQFISYHDITKEGIPVDLFGFNNTTGSAVVDELYSILYAGASLRDNADNQEDALYSLCQEIVGKHYSNGITAAAILSELESSNLAMKDIRSKLEPVLRMVDYKNNTQFSVSLPMAKCTWNEFLEGKKKIIVITFPDSMNNSNSLIDMLLASIYNYRSANKGSRLSLIIDEIENKNLEKNGPINKFMKESAKHGVSMQLATQPYSSKNERLFRIISNAGIKVFFSPQDDSINEIASALNHKVPYIEKLKDLEQGECIVKARFRCKSQEKSKLNILYGRTPDFTETPFYSKEKKVFSEKCSTLRINRRIFKSGPDISKDSKVNSNSNTDCGTGSKEEKAQEIQK